MVKRPESSLLTSLVMWLCLCALWHLPHPGLRPPCRRRPAHLRPRLTRTTKLFQVTAKKSPSCAWSSENMPSSIYEKEYEYRKPGNVVRKGRLYTKMSGGPTGKKIRRIAKTCSMTHDIQKPDAVDTMAIDCHVEGHVCGQLILTEFATCAHTHAHIHTENPAPQNSNPHLGHSENN